MGSYPYNVTPFVSDGGDDLGGVSESGPNFLTSSWDKIDNWFSGRNVDTAGMTPDMAKTAQTGQALKNLGLVTSVISGIGSAFSAYYAAKNQQYQEKSEASSLAFQSDMSAINASRAEMTAQSIEEAGKNQIADYTMRAGQQRAGAVASIAARGVALGTGSAADVAASMDVEKDLSVMAINSNTTRQAWAAREQETNYQNQSLISRTGAVNARRSAGSISPMGSVVNSLMGTATKVAGQWDWSRWMQMRMAQGAPVPQAGIGG